MSRRLVTPLIVAVLVTLATGLTFSTAGSSPAPVDGAARPVLDLPVTGLVVGRGLGDKAADDLSDTLPGWTVDVTHQRASAPVVVVALPHDSKRWRSYLLQYAADALPPRTTVVFQSLGHDHAAGAKRARHTAALLADGSGRR